MASTLIICLLISSYLIGGIPTGVLVARRRGIDIRKHGSGNIGATNVRRILGSRAGAVTLGGDVLKGIVSASLPFLWSPERAFHPALPAFCALVAVIGHCFSPYLYLRGGKGVAVAFGGFLVATPLAALLAGASFLFVRHRTELVSAASIAAALVFSILLCVMSYDDFSMYAGITGMAVILLRHSRNMKRLWLGKEQLSREDKTVPSD